MSQRAEGAEQTPNSEEVQSQEVLEGEGEPEQVEQEEGEDDTEKSGQDIEPIKGESAKETARRVFEQLKTKGEDKGSQDKGKSVKPEQQQVKAKQEKTVEPPAGWNAQQKEAFNKADPLIKEALAKREKDLQAHYTRKFEEASKATQYASTIAQPAKQYLEKNPHLVKQGFNEGTFISALVEAHQDLENPSKKFTKWLEIGASIGVDPDTVQELRDIIEENTGGSLRGQQNVQEHPEYLALQNQVKELQNRYEQQFSSQREIAVKEFTDRVKAVMDEMDESGAYVYPHAHDSDFIPKVRPLMSGLLATEPGITYEDAFRRSYVALYGLPRGQTARPTNQNNQINNFNNRARTAAVSVRGKTNSSVFVDDVADNVPLEILKQGAKATARYIASKQGV